MNLIKNRSFHEEYHVMQRVGLSPQTDTEEYQQLHLSPMITKSNSQYQKRSSARYRVSAI